MFVLHSSLAKINKQLIIFIENIYTYSVLLKVLQYKFEYSKYTVTVTFRKIIILPCELYHE